MPTNRTPFLCDEADVEMARRICALALAGAAMYDTAKSNYVSAEKFIKLFRSRFTTTDDARIMLRSERERAEISRERLARCLGVSAAYVQMVEAGKRKITPHLYNVWIKQIELLRSEDVNA